MSAPEFGRNVEVRHLKPGQDVPCDGRIYQDEHGQRWFGIRHPLEMEAHYRRLLREVEWLEKQRELDEKGS